MAHLTCQLRFNREHAGSDDDHSNNSRMSLYRHATVFMARPSMKHDARSTIVDRKEQLPDLV